MLFLSLFLFIQTSLWNTAWALPPAPVLPDDHHVEVRFKAPQADPMGLLRRKLDGLKANYSFPMPDLFPDTIVWEKTCFRKVGDRMFAQVYGEPLHFVFMTEVSRNEAREATFKKTRDLVESMFSTDKEDEIIKTVKVTDSAELKYFDECKRIWGIKWPRIH